MDHKKGVVTFIYSILEGEGEDLVESDTMMTMSTTWRVTGLLNGEPTARQMFTTRFF